MLTDWLNRLRAGLPHRTGRAARGASWIETSLSDVAYAVRLLRKDPAFAAIAIATLTLAIGASTTVFSVVNAILLKPLPYPHAERIVLPWRLAPRGVDVGFHDLPWGRRDFQTFARQTTAFESFAAFVGDGVNLTGAGEPVRVATARVSARFFPALGVSPAIGRVFADAEDHPGREREVMLGHRLWQERFAADPGIVGRAIDLNGAPYVIVGVMPAGFTFPRASEMPGSFSFPKEAEIWVPLALEDGPVKRGEPSELAVIGRLRPGVSARQAQAELDLFASQMDRQFPQAKGWFESDVRSLQRQVTGDTRRPLLLLLGAVCAVLLIACSNVAHLLLTRSLARARELGVRAALGTARGRLIRQLVTESVVLSLLGGVGGTLLALEGIDGVKAFGPASIPRLGDIALDVRVLLFAMGASLVTGIAFGLAPALATIRGSLSALLREGSGRAAGGAGRSRLRGALLISQVALALVLLIASGLLVRTFTHLLAADAGFRAEHVVTFELTLPASTYSTQDRMVALYHAALDRLRTIPGVESAAVGETVPMGGAGESTGVRIPDRPVTRDQERPFAAYTIVSPEYFSAVGTPLLRGRSFLESDTAASMPVAIVNRAMAEKYWPGQNVLGKAVGVPIAPFDMAIVGIVADVKHLTLREAPGPELYVPYTQKPWPSMQTMHVAVRVKGDPAASIAAMRGAIAGVDPHLPLANVSTLSAIVGDAVAQPRFSMWLISVFGAVAVALACVGLYGAVSYSAIDRTQEIGIRLALGAQRREILGMVLGQGMRWTIIGIAAGLAVASAGLRAMERFLYGVQATDAATFGAVSVGLFLMAVLACYVPARRATRVDPLVAMRSS
jgi:predicted permease